jgi:hypothetical protein
LEVERTGDFPAFVAASGNRFFQTGGELFPQLIVLERTSSEGR